METGQQNGNRKYRLHPFIGFLFASSDVLALRWLKKSEMPFYEQAKPLWMEKTIVVVLLIISVSASIIMAKDYIDNMDKNHFLTKYVLVYLVLCSIIMASKLFIEYN